MSSPSLTFETLDAAEISETVLSEAAELFSSAYGIWGPRAADEMGKFCKPGHRIKMNATRLRQQSLAPGSNSAMVRCLNDGILVGHAFATRWVCDGRRVCWVTQLCVRVEYRRRKVATTMLKCFRGDGDSIFGIVSSHPAAIMAALGAFGKGIEGVDLDYVRKRARDVMAVSPVEYVRGARLKGKLFENVEEDRSVCCADTGFWVDHTEPMAVLEAVMEKESWLFGDLPEGCEWLALVRDKDCED